MTAHIPMEFDIIRTNRGFTMRGWDFTRDEIADALRRGRMLNPAMELCSNACPWNCDFCFTEDPHNPDGAKRRLANELSLDRRLQLIDEAARLGARSINIVGAGEPTIDPDFWVLMERIASRGMTPIVFTEASLQVDDDAFVERLWQMGATVVVKVNSLTNAVYQNAVVAGPMGRKALRRRAEEYTERRNRAIDCLLRRGFATTDPTRLAFDTIMCRENRLEILDLHRWTRVRNIFVIFVGLLPSGRSSTEREGAMSRDEQFALFREMMRIDREEFGLEHADHLPYAGGTPCSLRGLGLYVKIDGRVFDCPGEGEALGSVREAGSLQWLWESAKHIRETFDGGCAPREAFWRQHDRLPIIHF